MDTLPFDLLLTIASFLTVEEYENLSRVNKHLQRELHTDEIARIVVKNNIFFSREFRQVDKGRSTFREALRRSYEKRKAMATAQPFAIAVMAFAETFLYHNGVVCYIAGNHAHVINVKDWSATERVINLEALFPCDAIAVDAANTRSFWRVLAHADGFVAYQRTISTQRNPHIVVVNTRSATDSRSELVKAHVILQQSKISFARLSAHCLWYGLHTRLGSRDKYYWDVDVTVFSPENHGRSVEVPKGPRKTFRIPLQGADLGETIAFEVFGNELYGVSTEPWSDRREERWVSYYYCMRISSADVETGSIRLWKVPRRDYNDGVMHDSWSQISLQRDETDGQIYISETRKEYEPSGGSFSTRTNYRCLFNFNGTTMDDWTLDEPKVFEELPRKRLRRDIHSEYQDYEAINKAPVRQYTLGHTDNRFYDRASMSFVDLVQHRISRQSAGCDSHIALRVASRKRKSPYESDDVHAFLRAPELNQDDMPIKGSEEDFTETQFSLWPPDNLPSEVLQLLDPKLSGEPCTRNSFADDFNVVFMPRRPLPDQQDPRLRPVILLSFDPTCNLPGLETVPPRPQNNPQLRDHWPESSQSEARSILPPKDATYWWEQPAAFTKIQYGFRFRQPPGKNSPFHLPSSS